MSARFSTPLKGWVTLHVATSKPHVYANRIIDHFGLAGYFGEVFGSELTGERADKSELLSHALKESGADTATTIMVGDRSHDMVGAANNGIDGVGVLYGYGSREELVRAGARTIVASVAELRGALTLEH